MSDVLTVLVSLAIVAAAVTAYMLPSIIAWRRHKRNTPAIFLLNFFFGWSFVGWVVALVWAFTYDA